MGRILSKEQKEEIVKADALGAVTGAMRSWKGDWMTIVGSAIIAWLIIALLFIAVAIVVYYVSLHATIKRINNRLETIYEVSATVERWFQRVALYLKNVVNNFFK